MPVHLPFGQIGAVSFVARSQRTDLSAEYEAWADPLALMSHRFVPAMREGAPHPALAAGDCQLTKREVECLRWASIGKTDKEISLILSRSHATVRFHIQNAGEKLNAVNRSQTIFKAAQLGYLGRDGTVSRPASSAASPPW
jgi:DNA-binding CsgD family transcriptional regulator